MKTIAAALTTSSTSTPMSPSEPAGHAVQAVPIEHVEMLFERLAAILGNKIADVYAGADATMVLQEWSEALAGFSEAEMRRGIAACRSRRFPPNLPEFVLLCRPCLDPETAWLEAEEGMRAHGRNERFMWSHPAVYWAARDVQHELKGGTYAQHRKRWDRLLAAQWQRTWWHPIPDPQQRAIAHTPGDDLLTGISRTEAAQRLKAIKAGIEKRRQLAEDASAADDGSTV